MNSIKKVLYYIIGLILFILLFSFLIKQDLKDYNTCISRGYSEISCSE